MFNIKKLLDEKRKCEAAENNTRIMALSAQVDHARQMIDNLIEFLNNNKSRFILGAIPGSLTDEQYYSRIQYESDKIKEHPEIESIKTVNEVKYKKNSLFDNALIITTKPLIYTTKDGKTAKIGRYIMALPIFSGIPRFSSLDISTTSGHCSPCCRIGASACFGTIEEEVAKLIRERNFAACAYLILAFIKQANPGTPYVSENKFIQARKIELKTKKPRPEYFLFSEFWSFNVKITDDLMNPEHKSIECNHNNGDDEVCCDNCGDCACFWCDYHERVENPRDEFFCFECERCGQQRNNDNRDCSCSYCGTCSDERFEQGYCRECDRCDECEVDNQNNYCTECKRGERPGTEPNSTVSQN